MGMRALADDERLVVGVRPHARVLLGPVLILSLLAPSAAYVVASVPSGPVAGTVRLLVLSLVGAVLVRACVVPFLQWLRTLYAVTDRRVVLRRGVLRRTGRDIPLDHVTEIAVRQTRWDRVLGAGRIRVQATGEVVPLLLQDVPAVEHVVEAMRREAGFEPWTGEDDDAAGTPPGADDSWDDEWEVAGVLLDPDAAPDAAAEGAVLRGDDRDGSLDDLIVVLPDDDPADDADEDDEDDEDDDRDDAADEPDGPDGRPASRWRFGRGRP